MKQVVAVTPFSDNKEYVIRDFLDHVRKFTYPFKMILVDNSSTNKLMNKLKTEYPEFIFIKGAFYDNIPVRISESQNKAVQKAMEYFPDYILSLECDVFPPTDCIERLLMHDLDCVGGLYQSYEHSERKPIMMDILDENGVFKISNMDHGDIALNINGGLVETKGIGLGCVLFKRDIIGSLKFWSGYDIYSDANINLQLYQMGVDIMADTSLMCEHRNKEW